MINATRALYQIERLGDIGWKEGVGMDRLPFSANYVEARKYVEGLMIDAGMRTRIDAIGNLFGRYEGLIASKKTILSGSHLDAVPEGGKYDGPLGVIGAIEAARTIHELGNNHPLEVVAFTAEEGGITGGTFGSRTFTGSVDMETLPSENVMRDLGLTKDGILKSRVDTEGYKAYVELHIEQGPLLETKRKNIGVPYAIAGITRYSIVIEGVPNHAGTTPTDKRIDAMKQAVEIMSEWYKFNNSLEGFASNIGTISINPGSPAIIPGKVEFVLELRSADTDLVKKATETMKALLSSTKSPFSSNMNLMIEKAPAFMDSNLRKLIFDVCEETGLTCQDILSGAMHDAAPLSAVMPSAMIFIPSKNGISHSKDEYSKPEDITNGITVLAKTLQALDIA